MLFTLNTIIIDKMLTDINFKEYTKLKGYDFSDTRKQV